MHGRVTVEPTFWLNVMQGCDKGPYRWFQRQDDSQVEIEVPNVKTIAIDRGIDQDAASCTITIYNVAMKTNLAAGDYAAIRGALRFDANPTRDSVALWGEAVQTESVIEFNSLLRTYQGFGGHDKSLAGCLNDGNLVLTGMWLVDEVQIGTDGMVTVKCRDMAKLLIEQQLYPPLVPQDQYPVKFCSDREVWESTGVIPGEPGGHICPVGGTMRDYMTYCPNTNWWGLKENATGQVVYLTRGDGSPPSSFSTEGGALQSQVTTWTTGLARGEYTWLSYTGTSLYEVCDRLYPGADDGSQRSWWVLVATAPGIQYGPIFHAEAVEPLWVAGPPSLGSIFAGPNLTLMSQYLAAGQIEWRQISAVSQDAAVQQARDSVTGY